MQSRVIYDPLSPVPSTPATYDDISIFSNERTDNDNHLAQNPPSFTLTKGSKATQDALEIAEIISLNTVFSLLSWGAFTGDRQTFATWAPVLFWAVIVTMDVNATIPFMQNCVIDTGPFPYWNYGYKGATAALATGIVIVNNLSAELLGGEKIKSIIVPSAFIGVIAANVFRENYFMQNPTWTKRIQTIVPSTAIVVGVSSLLWPSKRELPIVGLAGGLTQLVMKSYAIAKDYYCTKQEARTVYNPLDEAAQDPSLEIRPDHSAYPPSKNQNWNVLSRCCGALFSASNPTTREKNQLAAEESHLISNRRAISPERTYNTYN